MSTCVTRGHLGYLFVSDTRTGAASGAPTGEKLDRGSGCQQSHAIWKFEREANRSAVREIKPEILRREREANPEGDGQDAGDDHEGAESLAARGCYYDAHGAESEAHLEPEPGADAAS